MSKYDRKVPKNINKEYFIKNNYELIEGPNWFLVKPKKEELEKENNKQFYKSDNEKECIYCHTKFIFGQKTRNYCICRLFSYCENCGELIEVYKFSKFIFELNNLLEIHPGPCNNSCQTILQQRNNPETKNNIQIHNKFCKECNKITKHRGNKCLICNPESYGFSNPENLKEFNKTDYMRNLVSELRKNDWKDPEYANKIAQNLGDYLGNPDWAKEIGVKGREALVEIFKEDPYFGRKIIKNALNQLIWLWENDEEWSNNQREICAKNGRKTIHFALETIEYLRENDPEWVENQKKICAKNGIEYGAKNLENYNEYLNQHPEIRQENLAKARESKIKKLKELFSLNPVKLNGKSISFDDLAKLKKNDICGVWVLKARFKDYKGTNREKEVFKLGPFKSKTVYDEMDWARRVIIQPEKQDRWNIEWVISKWWYFANLYYDFNLVLLTDENGVTEEEALIAEAAYAVENDLFVKFTTDKEGRRIPVIERHAYWSP